ncbi:hypothetical protein ACIQF6_00875 [Kitasatospora sp. NPDC092948]|uniref:hypothetical protein n=1 Tax=Kitasatospora sp. NPDC092948 TaxID=3364088 RepID=UPI00381A6910
MTDVQLAPVNHGPTGPDDRADDATLRRLLRGSVFDTWSRAAAEEPPAPDRARRPAAGHCRFTMHYDD